MDLRHYFKVNGESSGSEAAGNEIESRAEEVLAKEQAPHSKQVSPRTIKQSSTINHTLDHTLF